MIYQFRFLQLKLILFFTLVIFSSCTSDKILKGVVLYSFGQVSSSGKTIKVGDIIPVNESIKTEKKSFCDLQLIGVDSKITIRIQPNTKFQLKQNPDKKLSKIFYGTAIFKVDGANSEKEKFQVETPESLAGVRGTKFEVSVNKNESTKISTYEGKVSTRYRFSKLEDSEKLKDSKTSESMVEAARANEVFIESKQSSVVTKQEIDNIYTDTGINTLLEKPDVSKKIDEKFSAEKLKNSLQKQKSKQKIIEISSSEMKAKLSEFSELIAIELSKLSNPKSTINAVKERNKNLKNVLEKRGTEIKNNSCLYANNFIECIFK